MDLKKKKKTQKSDRETLHMLGGNKGYLCFTCALKG